MSEDSWRSHRLGLGEQTLRGLGPAVLASAPDGIVLDGSAFYPGGGGQPPDHGVLLWGGVQTRIVGARQGDDLYLIPAEDGPLTPPGTAVRTPSALHVWAALCSGTLARWSPAATWKS